MITAAEAKALRTPPEEEAQVECQRYLALLDSLIREVAPKDHSVRIPLDKEFPYWAWTRDLLEEKLEALGYNLHWFINDDLGVCW